MHDAVHTQDAEIQVQFVLRRGLARDLNDEVDFVRCVGAEGNFVPRMEAHNICAFGKEDIIKIAAVLLDWKYSHCSLGKKAAGTDRHPAGRYKPAGPRVKRPWHGASAQRPKSCGVHLGRRDH
jgi:hypothetical protein